MKVAHSLFAAGAIAAATLFVAPASAGHGHDGPPPSSSSGGSHDPGGPTSVPEPADAVLLLMGVTGVVIGRKLHARAQRKG
ncbi:hypothetical protein [Sphingomonas sp. PR090111-T3T-6A]|uniref:hypothetical protein n=1 Tax=Sphingomonas sp. PR090111-T3T-6A TaxID=685778 RepID=UPI00035C91D4|nr:hypothetical protein [Sphingomonas sp. PR090111-T3T-6A]